MRRKIGNEGKIMKFITELELRDLYKKEHFTTYHVDSEVRLTPGARQFLADRRINMVDDDFGNKKNIEKIKPSAKCPENYWGNRKLHSKMKSTEVIFLLTVEELLSRDACLAQSVLHLYKQFSCIRHVWKNEGEGKVESLCCKACTGIDENNFSDSLDDCMEINDFHMTLVKGKEILLLHRLRCALQEIEPVAQDFCLSRQEEKKVYEEMIGKVNQIINSLSPLICSVIGGEKCQRT